MMNLEQVYDHYNSLNPHPQISKNTAESIITSVTYSGFKTICAMKNIDVKMAEFKRAAYEVFPEVAKIVGNNNIIIRLGKKTDYLEAYDVMVINLDEDKIQAILRVFQDHNLIEEGFRLLVVTFVLPKKEEEVEAEKLVTMMFKFIPKTEKPNEFFGYIL